MPGTWQLRYLITGGQCSVGLGIRPGEDIHPDTAPVLSAGVLELPECIVVPPTPTPLSLWELLAPDFGDYTLLSRSINTSEVGSVM